MTTTDPAPTERASQSPSPAVTVAVLYVDADCLDDALAAVGRQSYAVQDVILIGGRDAGADAAAENEIEHIRSFADFVSQLTAETDLVWVVHGDAIPRPDALSALVTEMDRNEASLVGSKSLLSEDSSQLESVGSASDVFGEPYAGLDPGEVDLEQYDVVRDVAFVSGVSQLIRRDLLKGLRGIDPLLPPISAGMDLSQRARIAGGRVMVAPSSEVLHARHCGHNVEGWRELAGRMRSMLKAYRWVTLSWVIPLATLVVIVDSLARLLLGSARPGWDLVKAVTWNIAHLPSTLAARAALRPVRMVRDEELFRYQVGGSVRLRELGTMIGERLGWAIDAEPAVESEDVIGEEVRRTGPVVATLVMVGIGLASRRLWFGGTPVTGFTLPPPNDALSMLGSYAGGWNPAGFGSTEPLHPATAILAVFQLVFGSGAQSALAILMMTLGVFGVARLLRRVGVTGASRYLAAPVLLLGPFTATLAGATHWAGMMAAGGIPWLVDLSLAGWPRTLRGRLGRLGLMAMMASLTVVFAPVAASIAFVAAVVGMLFVAEARWWSPLRALVVAGFGVIAVSSYLWRIEPDGLLEGGPSYDVWRSPVMIGLVLVATLGAIAGGSSSRWRVAAWGGSLVAVALGVVAVPGVGGETLTAAVLLGGLGAALAVGAALPVGNGSRFSTVAGGLGSLAAVAVVMSTTMFIPSGNAGIGDDEWGRRLDFVAALAPETGEDRVLLVGLPESLPGEHRVASSYAYRVIWGSAPTFDQAWLPSPGPGDKALALVLEQIERTDVVRPGELLAPFAIRWIVVLDEVPFGDALRAQVDLVKVPLEPGVTVFQNTAASPRAEADSGDLWTSRRITAEGPAGEGSVRLAENADPGWQPDWRQDDWANRLSASQGVIRYLPDPTGRTLAWFAAVTVLLGAGLAAWGRGS